MDIYEKHLPELEVQYPMKGRSSSEHNDKDIMPHRTEVEGGKGRERKREGRGGGGGGAKGRGKAGRSSLKEAVWLGEGRQGRGGAGFHLRGGGGGGLSFDYSKQGNCVLIIVND